MFPRLCDWVMDDPRLVSICEGLFGDDYSFNGGDGSVYYGDTGWHSDIAKGLWAAESLVRNAKVAFYLDPLTRERHHQDRTAYG